MVCLQEIRSSLKYIVIIGKANFQVQRKKIKKIKDQ